MFTSFIRLRRLFSSFRLLSPFVRPLRREHRKETRSLQYCGNESLSFHHRVRKSGRCGASLHLSFCLLQRAGRDNTFDCSYARAALFLRQGKAMSSICRFICFLFAKKSLLKKMRYIRSTPFFVYLIALYVRKGKGEWAVCRHFFIVCHIQ